MSGYINDRNYYLLSLPLGKEIINKKIVIIVRMNHNKIVLKNDIKLKLPYISNFYIL